MSHRHTLAVLDNQLNMPTAQGGKRTGTGRLSTHRASTRLSMKPGGLSSLVDGMAGLSMTGRPSDVKSMAGFGRGGMSSRRSSVYSARPSILALPTLSGSGSNKDPRPIRDKQWQGNAVRSLINFLVQAGYNQPVSAKMLQAPSAKDFQLIFKFLYAQLDPHYVYQKKFEDEVPVILKGLRYPFSDQISKSHLYSVGSMHAWPSLLAMLTWMVELILCCDQLDAANDVDLVEDVNDPRHAEKLFFQYLTKSYAVFLEGENNFDHMDEELENNFQRKNEVIVQESERLTKENGDLEKELKGYAENDSPLEMAQKQKSALLSDVDKFKGYIEHLEGKTLKLVDTINTMKQDLQDKGDSHQNELEALGKEKMELQATVDAQLISPADVDRMTSEREQLVKSLEAIAAKMEEVNGVVWQKEIALQKKMDQLEKLVQDYNGSAYRLGLIGGDDSQDGVNYEMELYFNASRAEKMVSVDLRNKVKPVLTKIRAKHNSSLHKAQDELIALQETIDRLAETQLEKLEDLSNIESRIRAINSQYEDEKKAIGVENAAYNQEIELLERDIQKMRLEANGGLAVSQQKLQKASMDYDQIQHQYKEATNNAVKQLVKALEDVLAMKAHVSDLLSDLKEAAVQDYNDAVAALEAEEQPE